MKCPETESIPASPACPYTGENNQREQSQARKAAHVAAELYAEISVPPSPTDELRLGVALDNIWPDGKPEQRLKYVRYVYGSRLIKGGLGSIIEGDGPDARFRHWVPSSRSVPAPATLFQEARWGVMETFKAGWDRYEAETPADELAYMWGRYNELLDTDPTVKRTGVRVGKEIIETGVETATEVGALVMLACLTAGKHPKLSKIPSEELLPVVLDAGAYLIRRGRLSLPDAFWSERAHGNLCFDNFHIEEINGRWRLHAGDGRKSFFVPPADHVPKDPIVHCIADLVKIRPIDQYTGMENAIFAGINTFYKQRLLNPVLAEEAWQKYMALEKGTKRGIKAIRRTHAEFGPEAVTRAINRYREERYLSIF